MQKERMKTVIFILVAIFLGVSSQGTAAQKKGGVEAFYKGATLRFIVPTNPGGIFDLLARKIAPSLAKHSGANVIVENMPGAGGLVGGGYIYNLAKPDGLTVGLFNTTGMALFEGMGLPTVKYKLDRFSYICRTDALNQMLFTSKASGFKTIGDMMKATKTIRVGATDPASAAAMAGALFIEAFGLNAKMVAGYKGIAEVMKAIVTGRELEAVISNPAGFADYLQQDQITVAAAWHHTRRPGFPLAPAALETPGLRPEGRKFLELGNLLADIGRMILAPPGLSDEKRFFLEKAFLGSLNEPDMPAWAQKSECNLSPLPGKESRALVAKVMDYIPISERSKFKHIIMEKYY